MAKVKPPNLLAARPNKHANGPIHCPHRHGTSVLELHKGLHGDGSTNDGETRRTRPATLFRSDADANNMNNEATPLSTVERRPPDSKKLSLSMAGGASSSGLDTQNSQNSRSYHP